jgi:hypothetical protein
MGNIMATSSHSNPDLASDDANTTPPVTMPRQQAAAGEHDVDGAARANALSNMQCVVDLADSVVCIADDLHERILQEIAGYNDRTMPDAQKALMRALTDDERLLRQYAHALYADAATFVIQDLKEPQHRLMALTAEAAEKIRRIGVIGEVTGLVGGILLLVGSIARGQFSKVGAALEKIQLHNATLKTLKPGSTAKT